jgi:hypothetical protein
VDDRVANDVAMLFWELDELVQEAIRLSPAAPRQRFVADAGGHLIAALSQPTFLFRLHPAWRTLRSRAETAAKILEDLTGGPGNQDPVFSPSYTDPAFYDRMANRPAEVSESADTLKDYLRQMNARKILDQTICLQIEDHVMSEDGFGHVGVHDDIPSLWRVPKTVIDAYPPRDKEPHPQARQWDQNAEELRPVPTPRHATRWMAAQLDWSPSLSDGLALLDPGVGGSKTPVLRGAYMLALTMYATAPVMDGALAQESARAQYRGSSPYYAYTYTPADSISTGAGY